VSGHQNASDDEEEADSDGSVTSVLTRLDAGLYTCVVKNIAGHVAHNISLFIEGQTLPAALLRRAEGTVATPPPGEVK